MEVLRVLSAVSLGERVDLDPEGDALLPAVLPGSELCADAVHLQTGAQAFYESAAFKVAPPTGGTKRRLCVSVCVCVRVTCTNTEVLFFMSHRNSAALSWEG